MIRDRRLAIAQRWTRFVLDALRQLLGDGWYGQGPGPGGRRRRAVDTDRVLVSRTHVWLRAIPSSVQPKQLCSHFPRVANLIAAHWDDTVLTDRLLIDLMADNRGDRAGFPARVRAELHDLSRLNLGRSGSSSGLAKRRWRGERTQAQPPARASGRRKDGP